MSQRQTNEFNDSCLKHLPNAYALARWLTHDSDAARDIVQDSFLRAYRGWGKFAGGDSRAWILKIVRNTSLTWLKRRSFDNNVIPLHDTITDKSDLRSLFDDTTPLGPEATLMREVDANRVHAAIRQLPEPFREVIVLRELEELSYQQISEIIATPVGTVMSRLSRARSHLRKLLDASHPSDSRNDEARKK